MLAEAKTETVYLATRVGIATLEKIFKKGEIPLDLKKDATLESAQRWDRVDGNFIKSANDYYSVYELADNSNERSNAVIGLTQELINLQKFGQARRWLKKGFNELKEDLSIKELIILQGRKNEKEGWIAGYSFGYQDGLNSLYNAVNTLTQIPLSERDLRVKESISTCYHWSGRNRLGLALMGINHDRNLYLAQNNFLGGIRADVKLEVETVNEKLGHGYAWKGRCALASNHIIDHINYADELIDRAGDYFQKHDEKFPNKGVMSHYEVVSGLRDLQVGLIQDARNHFQNAVDIRKNTGGKNYKKGLADAYAGIAATYLKEKDFAEAFKYLKIAAKANYYVVLRGFIGG